MSKGIKILWIVIGSMFALGVVLAAVGFAMGGSSNGWVDRHGVHFGNPTQNTVELADRESEPFENIDVLMVAADVEFVTGSSYGYEFTFTGTEEPTVEIKGGTLRVVEDDNNWRFNIFGLWNVFDNQAKLTVYVPSDVTLNSVGISTASGDTVISGEEVSIKTLDCQSASGGITASNLNLEQLKIDVASGDVKLTSITAKDAKINMVSGSLYYDKATLDSLVLDMASGDATIKGTIANDLVLRMVSGDADFDLIGNEEDYSISINRISGDIRINGRVVDTGDLPGSTNLNSSTGGKGRIEIDTTSGSVNINFKQ